MRQNAQTLNGGESGEGAKPMKHPITDAERCAIMERINERCSTNISVRAMTAGRSEPFLTVWAYPYDGRRAEFSWDTARRLSLTGGRFNLTS